DDAGVPGAARSSDGAGYEIGKDAGQDDPAPPQQAAEAEVPRRLLQGAGKDAGAGDDVEQDVPLRAEDHQRAEREIGIEGEADDQEDGNGKQQVGGKGGEELGQRL